MSEVLTKGNARSVRFSATPWFHPNIPVIIGGVGGIGSWLAFFLGRQECEIYIHDLDRVDETNMGGQLYGTNYLGIEKESAVQSLLQEFSSNNNVHKMGKFEEDSLSSPIMFSSFDNMSARKLMFKKWKEQKNREIFIDGRMLCEAAQVISVTKANEDKYIEELFDDDEVEDLDCSMKATSHCGAMTASYMVAVFNNYVANKKTKQNVREIPFKILFELPTLTNTVEI